MARIVLVGAGSITFAKNLLSDLLTFPELSASTIVLHDIDEARLTTAEAMAAWMVGELGVGAKIEAHADRRAALDGADYVINEIAVGGLAAVERDFAIPARYGVRQTIADTLGIGGIFRALRTIPVMVGIGNDLAELAPDATLFNYTNPMSMIPWAVYAGTPFRNVVGVCHAARDTQRTLAGLVGVPEEEISFLTAGVNHQAFVLRFERGGENLYPRLDALIESDPDWPAASAWRYTEISATSRLSRASMDPSTCPGSCPTRKRSSATASRSASTWSGWRRASTSTSRTSAHWRPGPACRSSAARSWPRWPSTPWRPAPAG